MRSLKDYLLLLLKGMAMGGADVVPGVSGGTMAFITGIYEELINSIKAVNGEALRLLIRFQLSAFWKHVNGNFLITILVGIAISLVSLARLILYLMAEHPISLWSFFFGLIIISSIIVIRGINKWSLMAAVALLIGVALAYVIATAGPSQTTDALWFIFISGAIAICAMILPGISGSFILLILGKYEFVIGALRDINLPVILVFAAGCIVGLLSFSHAISYLLKNFYNTTIALLAGFMLGSLVKIWPWKLVTSYKLNSKGEQVPAFDKNVWPNEFMEITGQNAFVLHAILFAALGIFVVVMIEKIASSFKKPL